MTIIQGLIAGFCVLLIVFMAWVLFGRKWLHRQTWPWSIKFFKVIEPVEIMFWGKSETLLWTRFLQALGVVLAMLQWVGTLDVTLVLAVVPEKWRPWVSLVPFLAISLFGLVGELQRRDTSLPLPLVAVPTYAPPEVLEVVAVAVAAKEEAVAVINSMPAFPSVRMSADDISKRAATAAAEKMGE